MESKLSKVKVNNEVELCRVLDMGIKAQVERALLAERISFFIKWETPGFFSSSKTDSCVFCVNEWQVESAEAAINSLGPDVEAKIKFIMKKIEKTLF